MRPSQALAALWALASVTVGFFPEEDTDEPLAFTLYEQEFNSTEPRHATLDLFETYRKFNGTAPEPLQLAAEAVRKGTVKNFPTKFDSSYLVPARIGTPPQTVNLVFDTASSDLWSYTDKSPKRLTKGHSTYKPSKSKTAKLLKGEKWSIVYGDGSSAGGTVYRDVARLGPVAIKGQAIEAASRARGSFGKAIDGIFGSGFTSGNTVRPTQQHVWFDNAKLKKKVFGAQLNKGKPGAYDIGYLNPKHYSGKVHYTKIIPVKLGYWHFRTAGYQIGGGPHKGTSFNAVADTGTTLALIPSNVVKQYYRKVRGAGFNRSIHLYIFPCASKLPSFSMTIGGSKRTIAPKYINAGFAGTAGGTRFCVGGLQPNTGTGGLSILGDIFLKSQYTVFDFGNKRIGFANK